MSLIAPPQPACSQLCNGPSADSVPSCTTPTTPTNQAVRAFLKATGLTTADVMKDEALCDVSVFETGWSAECAEPAACMALVHACTFSPDG
jgi:hypothetical protein